MATSRPDISFAIIARDRMSAVLRQLTQSTRLLGTAWRSLVGVVSRLNVAMLALSVAIPFVAAAFASLITISTAVNFLSFERAARRTRVQLQLLGFSATQARDQVNTLTSLMDRASATSFFTSQEAINNVALAGFELNAQLIPLSEKFADIIGANPSQVFNALFDAFARHDPTKFALLVTGVENLAIPMEVLDALELGDASPFLEFLLSITDTEILTGLEKLREDLDRIANLTRPTREALLAIATGIVDILIESIATRLEAAKGQLGIAFLAAFGTVAVLSGRSLGIRLGSGLLIGIAALLLTDMVVTIEKVLENPALVAGLLLASFALGRQIGGSAGGLVAGLVFILALELLPGILDAFKDLRLSRKIEVSAFATGIILGLATRRGFLQSFTLGGIFLTVVKNFTDDKNAAQTTTILGFTLIGTLLGGVFLRSFGGVLVGSLIGNIVGTILADSSTEKIIKDFGLKLGDWLMFGILQALAAFPVFFAARMAEAINETVIKEVNKALPGFMEIPNIPLPELIDIPTNIVSGAGVFNQGVTQPNEFVTNFAKRPQTFGTIGGITQFLEDFEHGGIVPGPLGAPVAAIVHGGEGIIPTGGGIILVQLILDKRVVGEVAIDAINRVARHNAGMVPGAIGS